jgi:hypothetical protein
MEACWRLVVKTMTMAGLSWLFARSAAGAWTQRNLQKLVGQRDVRLLWPICVPISRM